MDEMDGSPVTSAASPGGSDAPTTEYGASPTPSQAADTRTPSPDAPSPDYPAAPDSSGWEPRYKALQSHFTKLTPRLGGLRQYGSNLDEIQQDLGILSTLRQDPGFQQWAEAQLAQRQTGASDPETLRAIQIVKDIVQQEIQGQVEPIQERERVGQIYGALQQVAQRYGAEWTRYQPAIHQELVTGLSRGFYHPQMNERPTPEFLETLFLTVRARDPQFGARQHQHRLETLRAQQTQRTQGTAPGAAATRPAGSLQEAWEQAKRQLGLS